MPEQRGRGGTRHGLLTTRVTYLLAALALVAAALFRASLATRRDGFTIDEPYHVVAGASYVRTGDYRLNPEHPPLVKLWAGLFLPEETLRLPALRALNDKPDERAFAELTVYGLNDPEIVRERVRAAMLALNGALLLFLALAMRAALGPRLALATLLVLAIDPTIAAHLPVVMTDLPVALLASTAALLAWTAFRSWRPLPLAFASLALGGALAAKHSGILAALSVAALGAAAIARGAREGEPARAGRLARVALVLAGAVLLLWAAYRFRFAESPAGIDVFNRPLDAKIADVGSRALRGSLEALSALHVLPRAYLWGLADVSRAGLEGRAYALWAFGRSYSETPPYFFPGVLLVKLPLGTLALSAAGGVLLARRRGAAADPTARGPLLAVLFLAALFLAALAASGSGYAGVRHALPVVPPLAMAAAAALATAASGTRAPRLLAALALLAAAASALPARRPWEYYNELAGGTSRAWRLFGDEGLDIGQRSRELARVVREELARDEIPYLDYPLAPADSARRGIRARRWVPAEDDTTHLSGTFLLSAARLAPSPWYDLAPFREATPAARYGNLLLYRGRFELPWLTARLRYVQAMELIYAPNPQPDEAGPLLRSAVALYPRAFTAALELGNLAIRKGARDEALSAYRLALAHAPSGSRSARELSRQVQRLERAEPAGPLRNPWLE